MSARTALALLAVLLTALSSCGSLGRSYISNPGPYDRARPDDLSALGVARADLRAGELEKAHARLTKLSLRRPLYLPGLVLLQDVELQLLASGASLEGVDVPPDAKPAARREALRQRYQKLADARSDAASLVLAARIETDSPSALRLLDTALVVDPDCIWAHYGRGHVAFASGDFVGARRSVDSALALDSGHLPTRRLEARLLTEGGEAGTAVRALDLWIEDAWGSPIVEDKDVDLARLDLAIQLAKEGEGDRALEELDALERRGFEQARVALVRAAVAWDQGATEEAAAAIDDAVARDPHEPLGVLQRALLAERTGVPVEERLAAWQRALDLLEELAAVDSDLALATLLTRIQARVRLSELEREL